MAIITGNYGRDITGMVSSGKLQWQKPFKQIRRGAIERYYGLLFYPVLSPPDEAKRTDNSERKGCEVKNATVHPLCRFIVKLRSRFGTYYTSLR